MLFVLFSYNCSSMCEAQKEKKALTDRSKSSPVECDPAGNHQPCLITGLYPLLANLSSTLQSLKASMDKEQSTRKGTVRSGSHRTCFCFEKRGKQNGGKNKQYQDVILNKNKNNKK